MTARPRSTDLPDLRLLEPAAPTPTDRAGSPAAQQLLNRIVQTPRSLVAGPGPDNDVAPTGLQTWQPTHRPGRASRRTWALAGAAVVVAGGVVVASPTLPGGTSTAFASWTPVPTVVAPAEAAELQADCLSAGPDANGRVQGALTERRGDFTFTLVATDEAIGNCMVTDPAPDQRNAEQEVGGYSWGSSSDLPAPPADGTSVLWGATFRSPAGEFTSAIGRTGTDVVAVTLTSQSAEDVQARVDQGYFTAWWPGGYDDKLTVTTTLTNGTRATRTLKPGDR